MFKFEGGQELWLADSKQPVTVIGRTEFFNGKPSRYYVQGEGVDAWVNEDALIDSDPAAGDAGDVVVAAKGVRGKKIRSVKP